MRNVFKSHTRITMASVLFWLALCIFIFYVVIPLAIMFIKHQRIENRKNAAQPVIKALENYKNDKGDYPISIEVLETNGYIESPPWFDYFPDSGGYTLCFLKERTSLFGGESAECDRECYSSNSSQWVLGKGAGSECNG
jgi:hypothetical protein